MDERPDPSPKPRTNLILVGGGLVALAGVVIAFMLLQSGQGERTPPPPASQGGLVIDSSPIDNRLDPARPLRCFVAGQFVGELTLAQCAEKNGVATGALDVGVDETGALAAAEQAGQVLTPLPPVVEGEPMDVDEDADVSDVSPPATAQKAQPAQSAGACWRYADNQWRKLPGDLTLNACVQQLFAGRCERTGNAAYGRWAQQTLRLMPGRVEVSGDNRTFRPLVEQGPGCNFPSLG